MACVFRRSSDRDTENFEWHVYRANLVASMLRSIGMYIEKFQRYLYIKKIHWDIYEKF